MYNPEYINNMEELTKSNPMAEHIILAGCQTLLSGGDIGINDQSKSGKTLLHIAAENNYMVLAMACVSTFNADLQVQDNNGKTALDLVPESNTEMLNFLKNNIPQNNQSTSANEKTSSIPEQNNPSDNLPQQIANLGQVNTETPKKKKSPRPYAGLKGGFLNTKKRPKKSM